MLTFVCWSEWEEEPEDGVHNKRHAVEDWQSECAAEEYAERIWGSTDPFERVDIWVRHPNGKLEVIDVTVDWSPQFCGTSRGAPSALEEDA